MKYHPVLGLLFANLIVLGSYMLWVLVGVYFARELTFNADLLFKLPKIAFLFSIPLGKYAIALNAVVFVPTVLYCRYKKIIEKKKIDEVSILCLLSWSFAWAILIGVGDWSFDAGLNAAAHMFTWSLIPTFLVVHIYCYFALIEKNRKRDWFILIFLFILWCLMAAGYGFFISEITKPQYRDVIKNYYRENLKTPSM